MLIFDLNMFIPFVNGVKLQKVWLSQTHIWCFLVEKLNWKSKIAYLSAFMVKMGINTELRHLKGPKKDPNFYLK